MRPGNTGGGVAVSAPAREPQQHSRAAQRPQGRPGAEVQRPAAAMPGQHHLVQHHPTTYSKQLYSQLLYNSTMPSTAV